MSLVCYVPVLLERHHHFLSAQAHSTSVPWFELTKGLFKENTKFIGDINHFTFKDRLEVNFQKRSLIISLSHFLSVFNQLTPINPTILTSLLKNAKSKNQIFLSKASPQRYIHIFYESMVMLISFFCSCGSGIYCYLNLKK